MADQRSTIQLEVLGLEELQKLNRAHTTWEKHLEKGAQLVGQWNAAMNAAAGTLGKTSQATTQASQSTQQLNNSLGQATKGAKGLQGGLESTFISLLKYRVVSGVFEGIVGSIQAVTKAYNDMDRETARVSRVTGGAGRGLAFAALQEQSVATGEQDIHKLGEAYYQLSITIKDNNQLLNAYRTTMALVVGQEADSRETARALVQIHAQFREELNRTIPAAEQYGRIGEAISTVWKNGNLELPEFINTLKYLGPVMKGVQADLAQTFALAQGFSELGMRGRMIGTGLGGLIQNISGRYDKAKGGIETSKGFAPFKMFVDDKGGLDVVRTLNDIEKHMAGMKGQAREAYAEIIGGSKNAVRSLLALDSEATGKMVKELDDYQKALSGKTQQTQKILDAQLNTFASQFHIAWNIVLADIESGIDRLAKNSHLTGLLRDFNTSGKENRRSVTEDEELGARFNNKARTPDQKNRDMDEALAIARGAMRGDWIPLRGLKAQIGENAYNAVVRQFPDKNQNLDGITTDEITAKQDELNALHLKLLAEEEKSLKNRPKAAPRPRLSALDVAVQKYAADYKVPEDLVRAIIGQESGGNAKAISKAGAGGVMQLMPGTAAHYGVTNRFNVDQNVKGGVAYLHDLMKRYDGDLPKVIAAYNAGPGAVDKYGAFPPGKGYAETRAYVPAVLKRMQADPLKRLDWQEEQDKAGEKAKDEARKARDKAQREAEQAEQDAQQKRKDLAEKMGIYYDFREASANPFDRRLLAQAKDADRLAMAAGDPNERLRIALGLSGKEADLRKTQREDYTSFFGIPVAKTTVKSLQDKLTDYAEKKAKEQSEADESLTGRQNFYRQGISQGAEARIRALGLSARPNNIFGDADADELRRLSGTKSILTETIGKLGSTYGPIDPETQAELDRFKEQLAGVNAELRNLNDKKIGDALNDKIAKGLAQFEGAQRDIDKKYSFGFHRNDEESLAQQMLHAQETLSNSDAAIVFLKGQTQTAEVVSDLKAAQERRRSAQDTLDTLPAEYASQKYQSIYDQQKGTINSALMNFFHGKGDFSDVIKTAGNSVLDAGLEQALKSWNDPLITATTNEIAAMEGLKIALDGTTSAITGGVGGVSGTGGKAGLAALATGIVGAAGIAAVTRGGAGGLGGSNISGDGRADPTMPITGHYSLDDAPSASGGRADKSGAYTKYLSAGMAAYADFANGQQNGVTAGGLLGGVLSGASIGSTFGPGGGLIGGIVGGGLNLLGGLFGGGKKADTRDEHNPSNYNAPGDFDYYAYRYRTTGKYPTNAEIKGANGNPPAQVSVFVDGVRATVRTEIAKATSPSSAARTSTYLDNQRPIY